MHVDPYAEPLGAPQRPVSQAALSQLFPSLAQRSEGGVRAGVGRGGRTLGRIHRAKGFPIRVIHFRKKVHPLALIFWVVKRETIT
jgi:hypothetical protein